MEVVYICIHACVVEIYVNIPHLISLECLVDGASTDSLTLVIITALEYEANLTLEQI